MRSCENSIELATPSDIAPSQGLPARAIIAASALSLSITIAGCSPVGHDSHPSDTPQSNKSAEQLPACPGASTDAVAAVTHLLEITDPLDANTSSGKVLAPGELTYQQKLQKKASLLGLTMYDGQQYLEDNHLELPRLTTFDKSFRGTQKFARKYGITVSMATDADAKLGLKSLTPAAMADPRTIRGLTNVVIALGEMPVELLQENKIDTFVIGKFDKSIAGEVYGHDTHRRIGIDPTADMSSTYGGEEVSAHEISHIVDEENLLAQADCDKSGSIFVDKTIEAMNKTKTYYGNEWPNADEAKADMPMSLERYSEIEDDYSRVHEAYTLEEWCKMEQTLVGDAARVAVASPYGKKNPAEDKAEIGARIIEGDQNVYGKKFPILRAKAIEMLARMYQRNPQLAKFFAYKASPVLFEKTC